MTTSTFQVAQLVGVYTKPYFIIETMHTSDGPRDRICEGRYGTATHADNARKERQQGTYKPPQG